ncbi:MAG: DUF1501 domain-containing protein, partial [Alphaproteobacteria bacterium]
ARPGAADGALDLDGYFGLHPALKTLHTLYREKRLAIVPAFGGLDRSRSHFDAQDVLENGTPIPHGSPDGWLNRALAQMTGRGERLGLAVGSGVPLVLRGGVAVRSWEPTALPSADAAFLDRLEALYKHDPTFARTMREARASAKVASAALGVPEQRGLNNDMARRAPGNQAYRLLAEATGKLLADPNGPRIAVLEANGWDTHVNQPGVLGGLLPQLDAGMAAFRTALGAAWTKTLVVVVTEFGRTARENGGRGTDHGTASTAFLAGGAVNGGRIVGNWPGLADTQLFEARDLKATVEPRRLFKGILREHLGIADTALEDRIFPNSRAQTPLGGLVRRG